MICKSLKARPSIIESVCSKLAQQQYYELLTTANKNVEIDLVVNFRFLGRLAA